MEPYHSDDLVTLYHGDCVEVLRSLPDASVDSVVTDPPYKISQEYSGNADPDNLIAVASILPVAGEMFRVAKPGALCAMFYDTRILPLALHSMNDAGWKYLRALTLYRRWGNAHKLAGWMSTSDFILIFAKPGAPYSFNGPWAHDVYVRDTKETESFGHPAQKPLRHVEHIVANVTPVGGVALDPYMGSGTTGAAAVSSGRRFVGVEASADYFQVAHDRISQQSATIIDPLATRRYRDDGQQDAFDLGGGAA